MYNLLSGSGEREHAVLLFFCFSTVCLLINKCAAGVQQVTGSKKCSSTERWCLLYHHSHQLFQFESALLETFAKKTTHFLIAIETSVKTNAM